MNLPSVQDQEVKDKRVLVRADLDAAEGEDYRLEVLLPTIKLLSEKGAKITLIGHRGRPEGKVVKELSLKPVAARLKKLAGGIEFSVEENLRFDSGEEANSTEFARKLAEGQDFYVNEAFAASHRPHASIVGLPRFLPHAAGLRFSLEVQNLSKIFVTPKKPVVVILGGVKEDKLTCLSDLASLADKVLLGGKLPEFVREPLAENILPANLIADKQDLTLNSVEKFKEEIAKAGTLVLVGPMGKFEEEGHRQGTQEIFRAVSKANAYKVAGGGDTIAAIKLLGLANKFDWISVGGGASLEFLAKRTLPGISALLE